MLKKVIQKVWSGNDISDLDLYGKVHEEIASDKINKALWTKATVEAVGDEKLAKVKYIELRVAYLKAERSHHQKLIKEMAREIEAKNRDDERTRAIEQKAEENYNSLIASRNQLLVNLREKYETSSSLRNRLLNIFIWPALISGGLIYFMSDADPVLLEKESLPSTIVIFFIIYVIGFFMIRGAYFSGRRKLVDEINSLTDKIEKNQEDRQKTG